MAGPKSRAGDLDTSFSVAIRTVEKAILSRMKTRSGASAVENLTRLRAELEAGRAAAHERGAVDLEWFQRTVRWVVEWSPDTDLTLIAALGRIARTPPARLSKQ
ncbi:MAG TPA: hypothetical protein VNJ04_03475 [Gemmatimonadaceae bacterium]|nr:hypothetical protein [Gemmatimonadaceae bacterium]